MQTREDGPSRAKSPIKGRQRREEPSGGKPEAGRRGRQEADKIIQPCGDGGSKTDKERQAS